MGLFNYVKHSAPCWKCGTELTTWQTKDGDLYMTIVRPDEVREFYEHCPECKTWNQYRVVPTAWKIVPDDERENVDRCPACHREFEVNDGTPTT